MKENHAMAHSEQLLWEIIFGSDTWEKQIGKLFCARMLFDFGFHYQLE